MATTAAHTLPVYLPLLRRVYTFFHFLLESGSAGDFFLQGRFPGHSCTLRALGSKLVLCDFALYKKGVKSRVQVIEYRAEY